MTDIASSTSTGTFDMTRTTGVSSGMNRSLKDIRMTAAKLITTWSAVTTPVICSRSASISCGFTVRTTVPALDTASSFDRVVVTPSRSAISSARSARRHVTISSPWPRPPARSSPDASASPMRPPPRKATRRLHPSSDPIGPGFYRTPVRTLPGTTPPRRAGSPALGGLPGGRFAALAAGGLLLGGGAALLRAPAGARRPAASAGRARRVGDAGRPLLGHPLVLQRLVLPLVLDARSRVRHLDLLVRDGCPRTDRSRREVDRTVRTTLLGAAGGCPAYP